MGVLDISFRYLHSAMSNYLISLTVTSGLSSLSRTSFTNYICLLLSDGRLPLFSYFFLIFFYSLWYKLLFMYFSKPSIMPYPNYGNTISRPNSLFMSIEVLGLRLSLYSLIRSNIFDLYSSVLFSLKNSFNYSGCFLIDNIYV